MPYARHDSTEKKTHSTFDLKKMILTCAQNISKSALSRQKNPNVQLGSIFLAVNFFGAEHE
jgi:hypothetical protein